MTTEIKVRRDMAAAWSLENPILAEGEPGIELDDGATLGMRIKLGNGVDAWDDLPYSFAIALDDLTDVDLSGAANGDVLSRVAGVWESVTPAAAAPAPLFAQKPSATSVNLDITSNPDPHLVLALAANKTYTGRVILFLEAAGTGPDFRFQFTMPAGAAGYFGIIGNDPGQTGVNGTKAQGIAMGGGEPTIAGLLSPTDSFATIEFTITTVGTAGNLTLVWAQSTSASQNVTVKAGSYIEALERA